MSQPRFPSAYLDALDRRVLIYDGAMGTNIQRADLTAAGLRRASRSKGATTTSCSRARTSSRRSTSRSSRSAATSSRRAPSSRTPRRLTEWGLGDKVDAINVGAARLARAACDKYATPDHPRFVAGSMGPTGMLPSSADPTLSDDHLRRARGELLRAGQGARRRRRRCAAHRDLAGHSRSEGRGRGHRAAVRRDRPPRRAPGAGHARHERTHAARHRHRERDDDARVARRRRDRAQLLHRSGAHARADPLPRRARDDSRSRASRTPGSRSTPASARRSIRSSPRRWRTRSRSSCATSACAWSAAAAARRPSISRPSSARVRASARRDANRPIARSTHVPRVSSAMRAITLHQDPPPLLIGERVNAQGSRKVKRLLLAEDYEGIVRGRARAGRSRARTCSTSASPSPSARTKPSRWSKVVKLLSMSVESPLMIDSTEPTSSRQRSSTFPGARS